MRAKPAKKSHGSPSAKPVSRGAPVVEDILSATIEELARVGYGALRIEDVAARAGVHKTTIYRRYPAKQELVTAALRQQFDENIQVPNTGALREDLLELATALSNYFCSAGGRALSRLIMLERQAGMGELAGIVDTLRCERDTIPKQVFRMAVQRGEVDADLDPQLFMVTLIGSLHYQLVKSGQRPTKKWLVSLVDLLINGVLCRVSQAPGSPEAE